MHSRILLYLDTVARCGSIRKAGEQLNVASTAINRRILALEEELGTQLFQRLPRKLVLTAAGELLVAHARETMKAMTHTRRLIEETRGLHRGELTIAAMAGPTSALLPMALADLRRTHGNVRVHVKMLGLHELMRAVHEGDADLGIGFDLPRETGLNVLASRAAQLGAVMSINHPLAYQESVGLKDCDAWPLVVGDSTMAIRPHLEALYARLGATLLPTIETNSIELMCKMAMSDEAITFLTPLDIITELHTRKLKYLPFRDTGLRPQHLALVAHARNTNPLVPLLVDRIESLLSDLG
ncbi:LysR family transcriptional regulator [Gluconacetobacter asukensis]|uniref:LysR family transcriptional regulator n=1 Tax=Gluconacetobacter asukensis TaxID=1017181 RepID=A0A7W4IXL2_9PROT|nr:LysR family transcriptional regulator [Gluconacetobacter asukensis]MBB2170597.1 LysR family transcriptional regulator [Gluconacetobacter asukensis]